MKEITKYSHCFVCGDKNETGLKAKFYYDGEKATTELIADDSFEGYRGIYHGGIISTLLDEVMIKAILAVDVYAVTAEMTVKYHLPVRTGERLQFVGRVTESKKRLYLTAGEVVDSSGAVVASATGKYIEAKPELKQILTDSVENK